MVRQFIFIQILIFNFFLFSSQVLFAEVTAETNRSVLSIDETLMLRIKQTNASGGEPDLSALKKNFQILDQSQSQNYSFINGRSSSSHTWTITLLANNTGEVIIPAISVGNESTQPIKLLVNEPSSTPAIDGKEVFIEVSINPDKQVYVQQQILMTVSLFHRVRFSNASLSEPAIENTVVERIGNENNFQKQVGQYNYNVIERKYAVYPQQSGPLDIPGIVFNANIEQQQGRFSIFSRPGRRIISRTESVHLDVLPIPDNYTGKNWLPAKHIKIESNIIEDEQALKAGEALTRRIVVSAVGLIGSQLPAVNIPSSSDYKVYPDKETISSQMIEDEIVGTRQDTMAIIPVHSGQITLPKISIDWWNTETRQQQTTVLPSKTFSVAVNDAMPDLSQSAPAQSWDKPPGKTAINAAAVPEPTNDTLTQSETLKHNIWFWISLVLLLLWLATSGLLLLRSKKQQPKHRAEQQPEGNIEQTHKQLKQSCTNNDPAKATEYLIDWARLYYNDPDIVGLSQVLELIDDQQLTEQINQLEISRYSAVQKNWAGQSLCQALDQHLAQKNLARTQKQAQQTLAPLNPV